MTSVSSPSLFSMRSELSAVTPVMLPPGRGRLATKPSATGSTPTIMTMGLLLVARLAARIAGVPPV